jgi:hypothetical protein
MVGPKRKEPYSAGNLTLAIKLIVSHCPIFANSRSYRNKGNHQRISASHITSCSRNTPNHSVGRCQVKAMPELRWLVTGFPSLCPRFESYSGYVGFVADKMTLGYIFSEYCGFACHSLYSYIRGWYNWPNSGQCTKQTQLHPTPKK